MTRRDAKHARAISGTSREMLAASGSTEAHIDELDDFDISILVRFFKLLDRWDREVERNAEVFARSAVLQRVLARTV